MSSSALRPLRHTSTFIALKVNSALCEAASVVSKDLSLKQRQREAEAKKTTGDAKTRRERVKEAEKKVKEAHEMKTALEDMMGDTVDAYVYPLASETTVKGKLQTEAGGNDRLRGKRRSADGLRPGKAKGQGGRKEQRRGKEQPIASGPKVHIS